MLKNYDQLDLINEFSIVPLEIEDVFSFKVVLCDNEIDRDFERFSIESLYSLANLFKGKTGIFDHNQKSEGQMARIYDTEIQQQDRLNQIGEPYHALIGYAYMVRCDKNLDLIREIEAGIKKEVSVGCSVEKTVCSICGNDIKNGNCNHIKGNLYDGNLCHFVLENPLDAYEWSFVAVPAQISAGVTKKFALDRRCNEMDVLKKLGNGDVNFSSTESESLKNYIVSLEEKAKFQDQYKEEILEEVVKLGFLAFPDFSSDMLLNIGKKLDIDDLKLLKKTFLKSSPLATQGVNLYDDKTIPANNEFCI